MVLAIAGSAVSLYYYLQILKQVFVIEEGSVAPVVATGIQRLTISLLAAGVILFGCFPNTLLQRLRVTGSAPVQQHHDEHDHAESPRNSPHLLTNLR